MEFHFKNTDLVYDMNVEAKTTALHDVNLSLTGNGLTGILGPSGSGKSSLLYLMSGLKKPSSGQIMYGDINLGTMSQDALAILRRKEFGFIFQQHFLIHYMTVLENTLIPLNQNSSVTRERAMLLLERLGISRLAYRFPYQLSGGQRQRAAIARALINEPKVIFGDEPTAALDHKGACEVMELLSEYSRRAMVILVTHDESLLHYTDQIIHVCDGSVMAAERPEKENEK